VLIDENIHTTGPNALTNVRLRLATFNGSKVTPTGARTMINGIPSVLVDGGSYSALYTSDNQYIVFWFLGPRFNLNFILFSATDLSIVIPSQVVISAQANKSPVTNGPMAFRLCNGSGTATNYLSLVSGFGKSSPVQPVVNSNEPPATLKIFRIDVNAKAFTLVAQDQQSQYPNTSFAFSPVDNSHCRLRAGVVSPMPTIDFPGCLQDLVFQRPNGESSGLLIRWHDPDSGYRSCLGYHDLSE
jgi:hypothetical protein